MKFKKNTDGTLALDKEGNPIALLDDGTEQNVSDIDLEGGTDNATQIVNEIAKKFNIKQNDENKDGKTLTNDDVMKIIEQTVTKVRTEEKDKLHTQIDKSKDLAKGADDKVAQMLQGFKDEIMPSIQESIKKVTDEVDGMKKSLGTSLASSNNMQLGTLKKELIEQAKGNVIEELITGETSEEMLENFKKAVSMFNKYGSKKEDATEVKKDAQGNIITNTTTTTDEAPDMGIEIPEEFKDTKYDDLPAEVKTSVDTQIAKYYEDNPAEKEKLVASDSENKLNNDTTVNEEGKDKNEVKTTKYKLGGLNVARAVLSGNSGANANPTNIGMDLNHTDFNKQWSENREEMMKAAEQQAVGGRA